MLKVSRNKIEGFNVENFSLKKLFLTFKAKLPTFFVHCLTRILAGGGGGGGDKKNSEKNEKCPELSEMVRNCM